MIPNKKKIHKHKIAYISPCQKNIKRWMLTIKCFKLSSRWLNDKSLGLRGLLPYDFKFKPCGC
jgi:hypothetical protein